MNFGLFEKYLRNKFMSKVLIINVAVIILSLTILSIIISKNISSFLAKNEIEYNNLILYNVNQYFCEKIDLTKKIAQQAYLDNLTYPELFAFLENDFDKLSLEYFDVKKKFSDYIRSVFSRDRDIVDIIIYKNVDKSINFFSRYSENTIDESSFKYSDRFQQINEISSKIKIIPSFSPDYLKDPKIKVYTLTLNIKVLGTAINIGSMMIDFDAFGIDNVLSQYDSNLKGNLLILTSDGSIIYDSSKRYYGTKYPDFSLLKNNQKEGIIDNEDCIINLNKNNDMGVIVAGIIPKKLILSRVNMINHLIFITTLICTIMSIFLASVSIVFFSKRINEVINTMKAVRNGNLTKRIKLMKSNDEITEIAHNFNLMCDDLKEYIEKVYISELIKKSAIVKQKNAELNALQAQVNPHFLYNTLEAIRMKAVYDGNTDIGRMIFALSNLFRNSIKNDSFTTIKEEITNSMLYLDLFKIRYENKLTVRFNISPEIYSLGINKNLLQPIIENYIIHGFDSDRDDNCIIINGSSESNNIIFNIEDNGKGIDQEKLTEIKDSLRFVNLNNMSIGLINVNERIKIIYGENYGIDISSRNGCGTLVTMRIAVKTKMELINHVQSIDC